MRKTTLILAFLSTAAVLASAEPTHEYERFFVTSNDKMYVTDMEFNILQTVELPSYTEAITFNGERWWMVYNESEIYAFDLNGDYVTSFPAPRPRIKGMAWDGDCIWMMVAETYTNTFYFYERYPNGTVGPHGDFSYTDPEWIDGNGLAYIADGDILSVVDDIAMTYNFNRYGDFLYKNEIVSGIGYFFGNWGYTWAEPDYDYGTGSDYLFLVASWSGTRDEVVSTRDEVVRVIRYLEEYS